MRVRASSGRGAKVRPRTLLTLICAGYLMMKPNVAMHALQKLLPSIATKMKP